MNEKECEKCLHNKLCKETEPCKYYTPFDNDMTDDELDEYIENARREFHNDWWKYLDECAE